jgi:hypothetical protein
MKTANHTRPSALLTLCATCALAAGCATEEEYLANADFGNSVRETIALQTDRAGSAGTGMDGRKADAVLRAYRQDVTTPKAAEREIRLQVAE